MRIVDIAGNTITDCDLTAGELIAAVAVREDAPPIDNQTKRAWADEDYEQVRMYIRHPIKTAEEKIAEIRTKLRNTDYHILKVVEGAGTLLDCGEIIKQRAAWRKEINALEKEMANHGV